MSPSLTVNNTVIWHRISVDAPYQVKCTPTPGFKVCCCCWLKINTKFFSTSNWMTVLFLSVNEVKYINSRFFLKKTHAYSLGIKPNCIICLISFILLDLVCWSFIKECYLSVHSWDWSAIFLYHSAPIAFDPKVTSNINLHWKVLTFFGIFWKTFYKIGTVCSFNSWQN